MKNNANESPDSGCIGIGCAAIVIIFVVWIIWRIFPFLCDIALLIALIVVMESFKSR